MALKHKLAQGKFVITTEIAPPKGVDISGALKEAEIVKGKVDAINVTDLQSSMMRSGSLCVSAILKQNGYEPILQMTCRDRNRLALQSDLLSAAIFGIENVLILRGDNPSQGNNRDAKGVFDLDTIGLLKAAKALQDGYDIAGNKLDSEPPKFFLGAAANPGAKSLDEELARIEEKITAGAEFFQTQAVFDIRQFERFIKKASKFKKPILCGIIILKSAKMAKYMNENVYGINVPDELIKELDAAENKRDKAIQITQGIIRSIKGICCGVHIMPLGWMDVVPAILNL